MLRERGLRGGALFYDAQCDDARLTLATAPVRDPARRPGGQLCRRRRPGADRGRVVGAQVEDRLAGGRGVIRAGVVINATGPWGDRIRQMEDAGAAPLPPPTKGIHLVVERRRIDHRHGIIFTSPIDGRVMFILPWGDLSYIGTTDTETEESPDRLDILPDEVVYLLRSANARFPNARLTVDDVRGAWAGLRPLVAPDSPQAASSRSRDHLVVQGSGGVITVAGGKLTTYRVMAREVVDLAVRELRLREGRSRPGEALTDEEPLPGGETDDFGLFASGGWSWGCCPTAWTTWCGITGPRRRGFTTSAAATAASCAGSCRRIPRSRPRCCTRCGGSWRRRWRTSWSAASTSTTNTPSGAYPPLTAWPSSWLGNTPGTSGGWRRKRSATRPSPAADDQDAGSTTTVPDIAAPWAAQW